MAISGTSAATRFKGWLGLVLTLTPLVSVIPHPALQAVVGSVQEFIWAIIGATGGGLLASTPAIVGKDKPTEP